MRLWCLSARDRQEPPFHFFGVAHTVYVAAETETDARMLASTATASKVWVDPLMTVCREYHHPEMPGVVVVVTD